MATTLTAVRLFGCHVELVHLGDSRVYLLRDGRLCQMTRDDTLVQALLDDGTLTPAEAVTHPERSVIARALKGKWVEPTVWIRLQTSATITVRLSRAPSAQRELDEFVSAILRTLDA